MQLKKRENNKTAVEKLKKNIFQKKNMNEINNQ